MLNFHVTHYLTANDQLKLAFSIFERTLFVFLNVKLDWLITELQFKAVKD